MQDALSSISPPIVIIAIIAVLLLLIIIPLLLRRRSTTDQELPDLGSLRDYTAEIDEEPSGWRERFTNLSLAGKILLVIVPMLVIVSLVIMILFVFPPTTPVALEPTPLPLAITITRADVVNEDTISITADTTLSDGTGVQAEVLQGDQLFPWYDPDTAQTTVSNGQIEINLRRVENAPQATSSTTYTVVLADASGQVSNSALLSVPSLYADAFYGAQPTAEQPTATPTSEAAASPTSTPASATPTVTATSALTATVFNGGNVRREPVITSDNVVAQINAGETVEVIEKTSDGQWYRIKTIRDAEGWVSVTLLTIDQAVIDQVPVRGASAASTATATPTIAATVVAIPTAATPTGAATTVATPGAGLTATVFNGGNVRREPRIAPDNVVDQINARETVTLLQKTADSNWFLIRTERNIEGWVSRSLLTIAPDVAERVPVAQ